MSKKCKILAGILALILSISMLAACGTAESPPAEQPAASEESQAPAAPAPAESAAPESEAVAQTVADGAEVDLNIVDTFLSNQAEPDIVALNIMIEQFLANHPNITINRDQGSADLIDTKIPTMAASNELPDMFACRSMWSPNMSKANQVMSIEDLMAHDPGFLAGFNEGALGDFTYEGKTWGIPWRCMPIFFMYYNTDLLKEKGIESVPQTYEEFLTYIDACRAAGITPMVMGDKGKWQSRIWWGGLVVRTAGVDYCERLKSGELKFNDPSIVEGTRYFHEIASRGAFNEDFSSIEFLQARQVFYDKGAAAYGEMVLFAQIENTDWPEEMRGPQIAMTFFPPLPGEDPNAPVEIPYAADWGMAFNSNLTGLKLEAAQLFAQEVLGDEYNKTLAENNGMPVRPVEYDASGVPEAIQRYSNDLAPRAAFGGHFEARMPGTVVDAATAALQDLMLDQCTVEEALQRMQDALDQSTL